MYNENYYLERKKDLEGDLQVHSNWTDGSNTIEEMVKASQNLGYQYIAITDHTHDLAMTGGSDEKKLLKQVAEIDKINHKLQTTKYKIHNCGDDKARDHAGRYRCCR